MARKSRSERRRERSFPDDAAPQGGDARAAPVASIADRALNDIAQSVQARLRASAVVIAVELDGQMTCRARAGAAAPEIGTPVQRDRGVTGECVSTGAVICCHDVSSDPRVDAVLCEQLRIRSIVLVPLLRRGRVLGVVEAFFPTRYGFDDRAVQMLQEFAHEIVTRICGADEGPVEEPAPAQLGVASAVSDDDAATGPTAVDVPLPSATSPPAQPADTSAPAVPPTAYDRVPEFQVERRPSGPTRRVAMVLAVVVALAVAAFLYDRYNTASPVSASRPPAATQPADPLGGLLQAAQGGDATAQYKLAQAYKSGSGVPADPQQAHAWLVSAAEHGNPDAQFEWAHTLETSEDPDLVQAYTWYVIAGQSDKTESEQAIRRLTPHLTSADIAQVRYRVAETILEGRALRRDPVAAYFWFALSEWGGNEAARAPIQQLESQLTPAQLRDAKSRASAWIRRHTAPATPMRNPPSTASH